MPKNEITDMRDMLKKVKKDKQAPKAAKDQVTLKPIPKDKAFTEKAATPEELKSLKLERVFFIFFDMNQNKVIDWNDFETLTEKIGQLRGQDSREFTIVSDALRVIWKGIVGDIKNVDLADEGDQDIEITLDEWKELWKKREPSKNLTNWQWDYLKYMFFLMDTSGDKKIDLNEYIAAMKLYSIESDEATAAFQRFAVDKDGAIQEKLDYGQFVKLWKEYFSSGEKSVPGNFLFGV